MTREQTDKWAKLVRAAERVSEQLKDKDSPLAECVIEFPEVVKELDKASRVLSILLEAYIKAADILDPPIKEEPCAHCG